MVPLLAAGRRLARDTRGVAAVEFALLAPVLLLLMAGLVDGSRLILGEMQINAAAQAGADYALRNGWDPGQIAAAVTTAGPAATSPTVTLSPGCVVGGTITPVAAGAACASGGAAGRYVTVAASAPFKPVAPWPGLKSPQSLSAQAMVRIP